MRISDRFKGREAYSPGGKPCPVVLNANESFVRPSAELMEEFQAILANCDFNRYPDPRATALCQAFADLFKVDWQNVTAGNGSDELIELLFACLVAPHDRVVTVNPDFSMYGNGAYMNGVEEIVYQQEDYSINVDTLIALCKERDAAMLIFSNPCNPTGVEFPREAVLRILDEFDGIVVGAPVYYAGPAGQATAFLDRLFYSAGKKLRGKPGAAVVSCRRGGASAAFDRLNKYFSINSMPIVTSQYWNQVHGNTPEEVRRDEEGLQTMRTLGENMAWLLRCIAAGKAAGIAAPNYEAPVRTNFIR